VVKANWANRVFLRRRRPVALQRRRWQFLPFGAPYSLKVLVESKLASFPSEKAVAGGLATRESEIDPEALALRDRFGDVRVAGDS
jgi:hypothetical protein